MLTVDSREPWTTADYPKLRYPSSSIRLLHIHPGSGKRRVECTMETFLFANKPHYDALSYTWGDMRWKTSVTVNGKMMDITENLYNALLSIRLPEETRTVWVDQICIDQTNIEEKSSQVPLMTFIYSRASNVLIWLG
ncbi:heterokaryon incompatibility protein-domain-containing protein, partial [Tricladium varicosporioides]